MHGVHPPACAHSGFVGGLCAQAFGNAAMILASGKKGSRFALPHARIMTAPPRINRSFGSTSNIMIKANELEYNTNTYVEFLAKFTGGAAAAPSPLVEFLFHGSGALWRSGHPHAWGGVACTLQRAHGVRRARVRSWDRMPCLDLGVFRSEPAWPVKGKEPLSN